MIFSHHLCCCLCTQIQHVAVEFFSSNSPRRSPQCPHHPLLHQVRHSVDCGAGTAPFLAVNSATIVVNHLAHFIKIIATGPMHAWPNPRRWSVARELASGVQSTWMPLGRRIGNSSEKEANKLLMHIYNILSSNILKHDLPRRGKPLFLNMERYQLLENQWLAHRFDHTNRKWIWHRDQLWRRKTPCDLILGPAVGLWRL